MEIKSGRLTVTASPALIIPSPQDEGGYTLIVQNMSNAKSVFLDGETVTPETGFELIKGQSITIPIAPDEALYAVSDIGDTIVISYLVTRR